MLFGFFSRLFNKASCRAASAAVPGDSSACGVLEAIYRPIRHWSGSCSRCTATPAPLERSLRARTAGTNTRRRHGR